MRQGDHDVRALGPQRVDLLLCAGVQGRTVGARVGDEPDALDQAGIDLGLGLRGLHAEEADLQAGRALIRPRGGQDRTAVLVHVRADDRELRVSQIVHQLSIAVVELVVAQGRHVIARRVHHGDGVRALRQAHVGIALAEVARVRQDDRRPVLLELRPQGGDIRIPHDRPVYVVGVQDHRLSGIVALDGRLIAGTRDREGAVLRLFHRIAGSIAKVRPEIPHLIVRAQHRRRAGGGDGSGQRIDIAHIGQGKQLHTVLRRLRPRIVHLDNADADVHIPAFLIGRDRRHGHGGSRCVKGQIQLHRAAVVRLQRLRVYRDIAHVADDGDSRIYGEFADIVRNPPDDGHAADQAAGVAGDDHGDVLPAAQSRLAVVEQDPAGRAARIVQHHPAVHMHHAGIGFQAADIQARVLRDQDVLRFQETGLIDVVQAGYQDASGPAGCGGGVPRHLCGGPVTGERGPERGRHSLDAACVRAGIAGHDRSIQSHIGIPGLDAAHAALIAPDGPAVHGKDRVPALRAAHHDAARRVRAVAKGDRAAVIQRVAGGRSALRPRRLDGQVSLYQKDAPVRPRLFTVADEAVSVHLQRQGLPRREGEGGVFTQVHMAVQPDRVAGLRRVPCLQQGGVLRPLPVGDHQRRVPRLHLIERAIRRIDGILHLIGRGQVGPVGRDAVPAADDGDRAAVCGLHAVPQGTHPAKEGAGIRLDLRIDRMVLRLFLRQFHQNGKGVVGGACGRRSVAVDPHQRRSGLRLDIHLYGHGLFGILRSGFDPRLRAVAAPRTVVDDQSRCVRSVRTDDHGTRLVSVAVVQLHTDRAFRALRGNIRGSAQPEMAVVRIGCTVSLQHTDAGRRVALRHYPGVLQVYDAPAVFLDPDSGLPADQDLRPATDARAAVVQIQADGRILAAVCLYDGVSADRHTASVRGHGNGLRVLIGVIGAGRSYAAPVSQIDSRVGQKERYALSLHRHVAEKEISLVRAVALFGFFVGFFVRNGLAPAEDAAQIEIDGAVGHPQNAAAEGRRAVAHAVAQGVQFHAFHGQGPEIGDTGAGAVIAAGGHLYVPHFRVSAVYRQDPGVVRLRHHAAGALDRQVPVHLDAVHIPLFPLVIGGLLREHGHSMVIQVQGEGLPFRNRGGLRERHVRRQFHRHRAGRYLREDLPQVPVLPHVHDPAVILVLIGLERCRSFRLRLRFRLHSGRPAQERGQRGRGPVHGQERHRQRQRERQRPFPYRSHFHDSFFPCRDKIYQKRHRIPFMIGGFTLLPFPTDPCGWSGCSCRSHRHTARRPWSFSPAGCPVRPPVPRWPRGRCRRPLSPAGRRACRGPGTGSPPAAGPAGPHIGSPPLPPKGCRHSWRCSRRSPRSPARSGTGSAGDSHRLPVPRQRTP